LILDTNFLKTPKFIINLLFSSYVAIVMENFVGHFFTQKKEKRVLLNKRWPLLLPFFVVQGTGYRF
jgi:hypothetical protein